MLEITYECVDSIDPSNISVYTDIVREDHLVEYKNEADTLLQLFKVISIREVDAPMASRIASYHHITIPNKNYRRGKTIVGQKIKQTATP